jgi:hypothetical protein
VQWMMKRTMRMMQLVCVTMTGACLLPALCVMALLVAYTCVCPCVGVMVQEHTDMPCHLVACSLHSSGTTTVASTVSSCMHVHHLVPRNLHQATSTRKRATSSTLHSHYHSSSYYSLTRSLHMIHHSHCHTYMHAHSPTSHHAN